MSKRAREQGSRRGKRKRAKSILPLDRQAQAGRPLRCPIPIPSISCRRRLPLVASFFCERRVREKEREETLLMLIRLQMMLISLSPFAPSISLSCCCCCACAQAPGGPESTGDFDLCTHFFYVLPSSTSSFASASYFGCIQRRSLWQSSCAHSELNGPLYS